MRYNAILYSMLPKTMAMTEHGGDESCFTISVVTVWPMFVYIYIYNYIYIYTHISIFTYLYMYMNI